MDELARGEADKDDCESSDGDGGDEQAVEQEDAGRIWNKGGDARTVGETTAAGTSVGAVTGSAAGHAGMGAGDSGQRRVLRLG